MPLWHDNLFWTRVERLTAHPLQKIGMLWMLARALICCLLQRCLISSTRTESTELDRHGRSCTFLVIDVVVLVASFLRSTSARTVLRDAEAASAMIADLETARSDSDLDLHSLGTSDVVGSASNEVERKSRGFGILGCDSVPPKYLEAGLQSSMTSSSRVGLRAAAQRSCSGCMWFRGGSESSSSFKSVSLN